MANALKNAPLKKEGHKEFESKEDEILDILGIELDPARRYVFELANENYERELPVYFSEDGRTFRAITQRKFKPYQNIILTSQIVWQGKRVNLRYYDGCDTIFASDQPREKDAIDQFIKSTRRRDFLNGYFSEWGYEKMLLTFMFACSWNTESPFRTRTANSIFKPQDIEKKASAEDDKLNLIEQALGYAREASEKKMKIHAAYLDISLVDDVGNELSPKAIRAEYRNRALRNPKQFIESYTDDKIEIRHFINKALESGTVENKSNPNKAQWKTGTPICDIAGLKTFDAISNRLFEFSQTTEGEEFLIQLKALYN